MAESIEDHTRRLVLEYAQKIPDQRPLPLEKSLRTDLEIESLPLISLAIQLGDEFGIDLTDEGLDLSKLETVGDLVVLVRTLKERAQ